jgi:hypothetical protein
VLLGGDPLVYECKTKYKGKWYMPGEEVPEEKSQVPSDFTNPPENPITYTKTEINRMSTADLQKLATEQGIENAQVTSGVELKEILIAKFNL